MATVKCLFAVEFQLPEPHRCSWHTHECTEIIFYCGCSGWLPQGRNRYPYHDGDVAVYQPGAEHADEMETSGSQLCIGVSGCGAEKLPGGVRPAGPELQEFLQKIRMELSTVDSLRQERLDLLAGGVVLELRRQEAGANPAAAEKLPFHVAAAKEILDACYTEPLRIQEVAERLVIHPDYLRHLFRQTLGESPVSYLIRRRLESAKELLCMTDHPVHEIARAAGFENPHYFCRLFKRWSGQTPTAFRTKHRKSVTG